MRRTLLFVLLVCTAVAAGCGGNSPRATNHDEESREVPVTVSKAAIRSVSMEMSATGDVKPFADASVISEVAGVIEKLPVERGQRIEAGDVVAVVEHAEASVSVRQAEAALQTARAQVLQAKAALANLEIERKRIQELFESKTASKQMLDSINSNHDVSAAAREVALAQVAQAEAALEQARVFLANHTVCAPISGVITDRYVDAGDKNNPSQPIVSIAQVNPVKVMCDFPERDLPLLGVGQNARVQLDAYPGEEFTAQVTIISPVMNPVARTVAVELRSPNPDGRLRPGMFARVTVIGEETEILAVPDDALMRIPGTGAQFVFVVDDKVARRVDLGVGRKVGGWTEVSGDIRAGDLVVVEGQSNLKSGGRVRIASETEGTP